MSSSNLPASRTEAQPAPVAGLMERLFGEITSGPNLNAWKKHLRTWLGPILSFVLLTYLVLTYDLGDIGSNTWRIEPWTYVLVFGLLTLNTIGSCLRFSQVVRDFGALIPTVLTFRAALYGTISGLFFFQVIGQAITRALLLKKVGVPSSSVLLMTLYERGLTSFALLAVAIIGAQSLFQVISIDLTNGGFEFVRLSLALGLAVGLTTVFALRREFFRATAKLLNATVIGKAARILLITVIVHAFMIASYTTVAASLAPNVAILDLVAASAIISFIAALPISFSGWGVRELSSLYVYGSLGIAPETALAISIVIGLLSMSALFASVGGMALFFRKQLTSKQTSVSQDVQDSLHNIGDLLNLVIPAMIAVFVLFQVRIPLEDSQMNVNLADPIALLGLFIFGYAVVVTKALRIHWIVPQIPALALLCSAIFVFGYLNGLVSFGSNSWALANRLAGWFILLAYASSGALLIAHLNQSPRDSDRKRSAGFLLLTKILVASCAAVVMADLIFYLMRGFGVDIPIDQLPISMEGFSNNPNALTFLLCTVLALSTVFFGQSTQPIQMRTMVWAALNSLLIVGIWFTSSRTGYAVAFAIIVTAIALNATRIRWLFTTFGFAACVIASVTVAPLIIQSVFNGVEETYSAVPNAAVAQQIVVVPTAATDNTFSLVDSYADQERKMSIEKGLELWIDNPIFGAGLGAFVDLKILNIHNAPLVIHNGAVWLLAELGLVGFSAVGLSFLLIVLPLLRNLWVRQLSQQETALFLVLIVFALSNVPHDMFFQRIFWFVFGALLVHVQIRDSENRT